MKAELKEVSNCRYSVYINNIEMKEDIFDTENIGYVLRFREDLIDNLINWISEAKESDKFLMKEDLKYLIDLEDEYVFSSISTNEYIAKSDNEEEFNNICKEILKECGL